MLKIKRKSRGGFGSVPGFAYDGSRKVATLEVTLPGSGSKKRRRKVLRNVETRGEALTAWKAFREEVLHPKTPEPAPIVHTLRSYVDENWSKIVARVRPHTASGYATHLNFVILPELGDLLLPRINAAEVRDFAGRMVAGTVKTADGKPRTKGYSPQTVNHCLAILRRILRDAVDREELAVFPIRGRLPMLKPVLLKQELSPAEWNAFVAAFDDEAGFRRVIAGRPDKRKTVTSAHYSVPRKFGGGPPADGLDVGLHFQRFRSWRPFFVAALETGLRRGDLMELRWSSVDLAGGWLRVVMSKTKEEAVIPISPACKSALNEMRFRRKDAKDETEYVFPERPEERERRLASARAAVPVPDASPETPGAAAVAETPRPTSSTMLYRYFTIAKASAGIKRRLRFHDLRHSFASRLASAGVSLQVIAKMLGHTTVTMSQRYARPDEAALRAAIDAVAKSGRLSPENTSENTSASLTGR